MEVTRTPPRAMDLQAVIAHQAQFPMGAGNSTVQLNSVGPDGTQRTCVMMGPLTQRTMEVAAGSTNHYDVVMRSVAAAIRMIQYFFESARPMVPSLFMEWAHYCLNLPLQYPDGLGVEFRPCPPINSDLGGLTNQLNAKIGMLQTAVDDAGTTNARLTAALAASEATNTNLTAALAASEATNANLTAALAEANGAPSEEPNPQIAKLQKKFTKAKESLAASEAARAVLTTQLATMIQALGAMKAEVKEDEPETTLSKRRRGK